MKLDEFKAGNYTEALRKAFLNVDALVGKEDYAKGGLARGQLTWPLLPFKAFLGNGAPDTFPLDKLNGKIMENGRVSWYFKVKKKLSRFVFFFLRDQPL